MKIAASGSILEFRFCDWVFWGNSQSNLIGLKIAQFDLQIIS